MINKCNPNCAVCQGKCIYTTNNPSTQSMTRICDCYIFYDIKENSMTKEEAKAKLRKAESDLRQANVVLEMHEQGIKEIKEEIEKLQAIISKKDNWRLVEVPDSWQKLYEEKALLMADMMHFAYVKNEGWVPNWGDDEQDKYGLSIGNNREIYSISYCVHNCFLFGIAVKSGEIARKMLEEFGKRIERIYNKQY